MSLLAFYDFELLDFPNTIYQHVLQLYNGVLATQTLTDNQPYHSSELLER